MLEFLDLLVVLELREQVPDQLDDLIDLCSLAEFELKEVLELLATLIVCLDLRQSGNLWYLSQLSEQCRHTALELDRRGCEHEGNKQDGFEHCFRIF
jgi:hypothetical protein